MPVDGDIPVLFGLHLRYLADGWGDVWNLAPILERRFCCLHCIAAVFHSSTGLYGSGLCIVALAALMFGVLEENRNLVYSDKSTYGAAGFMPKREMKRVLDLVPNIRKHPGIILGALDKQVVCVPLKTRFNGNLAVYESSGSKKTRAFCANTILQSVARKSSLIISEPKSELYEKTSEYLRDQGYTINVFHLVTPAASDSWNCLSESESPELMAQLFCDVVTKNTSSGREAAAGTIKSL